MFTTWRWLVVGGKLTTVITYYGEVDDRWRELQSQCQKSASNCRSIKLGIQQRESSRFLLSVNDWESGAFTREDAIDVANPRTLIPPHPNTLHRPQSGHWSNVDVVPITISLTHMFSLLSWSSFQQKPHGGRPSLPKGLSAFYLWKVSTWDFAWLVSVVTFRFGMSDTTWYMMMIVLWCLVASGDGGGIAKDDKPTILVHARVLDKPIANLLIELALGFLIVIIVHVHNEWCNLSLHHCFHIVPLFVEMIST